MPAMLRTNYTAIQQLFNAPHPSVPFFVASLVGLLIIFLPAMFRRTNKFPVKGRVSDPLIHRSKLKLVLITGGSQGLGEAMGIQLAKKGADIVLVSRSREKLELAVKKLEVSGHADIVDSRLHEYRLSRSLHFTAQT